MAALHTSAGCLEHWIQGQLSQAGRLRHGAWLRGSDLARNILFICSQNRLRSPTAEQVFADWPGIETSSAGLNHDAENPVTPELLEWAQTIFVMERAHRSRLGAKFKPSLGSKHVVCLDIPDEYEYMAPDLVRLLKAEVSRYLPRLGAG
jgi:predicted protein tyrosine phosphatase